MVARGPARVLKPTGTFWLNLGDTYARTERDGDSLPGKSLLLAPERVALSLIEDGWVLRNRIVWAKPNPMPTSVRDRLSCTWEIVYCFARSRSYYLDLDSIRVPHRSGKHGTLGKASKPRPAWSVPTEWRAPLTGNHDVSRQSRPASVPRPRRPSSG